MKALARISLIDPTAVLAIGRDEVARVSLAWWATKDEPMLIEGPNGPCTVVVHWPTDRRGYLDAASVRRGEVFAVRWDIAPVQLERLRGLVRVGWNLEQHDLFVHDGGVGVARESLHAVLELDLDRAI